MYFVARCIGALTLTLVACSSTSRAPAAAKKPKPDGIAGVVVDAATGDPISFVTVIARSPLSTRTHSQTTAADGSFHLSGLRTGTYQVLASLGNQMTEYVGVPVRAGTQARLMIRLDLRAQGPVAAIPYRAVSAVPALPQRNTPSRAIGTIEGSVRNAKTKELLPGAVIGASSAALDEPRLAVADHHGRYRLVGLPPGTYVVSIYYTVVDRGNVEVRRGDVKVHGGKATLLDLLLDTEAQ